jgi:hypothetical protein
MTKPDLYAAIQRHLEEAGPIENRDRLLRQIWSEIEVFLGEILEGLNAINDDLRKR